MPKTLASIWFVEGILPTILRKTVNLLKLRGTVFLVAITWSVAKYIVTHEYIIKMANLDYSSLYI